MNLPLKRSLLLFSVLLLFAGSITTLLPKKALAADIDPSNLCVPRYNQDYSVNNSVELIVINRAQIFVHVLPSGNCASPDIPAEYFTPNRKWSDINGYDSDKGFLLVDTNTSDGNYDYRYNGPGAGDTQDDTRLNEFGGGLDDLFKKGDNTGGRDASVSPEELKNALGTPEVVFGIEEDQAGVGCSGGQNWNFTLKKDGDSMKWSCESGNIGGSWTGLRFKYSNFKNPENFNVTYYVEDQAGDNSIKVVHVSDSQKGSRTFSYCASGKFRNGTDCTGNLELDVSPVALRASSTTNIPATIYELDGNGNRKEGNSVNVTIAGADTLSSLYSSNVTSGVGADSNPTCEMGFSLSWITCGLFNAFADLTDVIFEKFIQPLLVSPSIKIDATEPIFKVWSSFRVIGNIFLLFGLLFIVFGQSIGGGLVDAYTAKKMAPRIIIAAILINLSIYLVAIAVDVTNVIGGALGNLIIAPFAANGANNITNNPATGGVMFLAGGAATGLATALIFGGVGPFASFIGLFLLLPAALIAFAILLVLLLRRGLIILLILVSPVALALYVLPNTERYFKKWWEALSKALLIYPIVVVLFAISDVLVITLKQGGQTSGPADVATDIGAFIAMLAPLFLIPFAFKLAGGVLGGIYSTAANFGKKGTEVVKGNAQDPNSLRNRVKRGVGENYTRNRSRWAHEGRDTTTPRTTFKKLRGRLADMGNVDQQMATYNLEASKRREALTSTGLDDLIYAGAGYESHGQYFDGKGREISKQTYDKGKSLYGSSSSDIQTALNYTLGKVQNDTDRTNFRKAYVQNAIKENWNEDEARGVWAGATYPHKSTHASEWYSSPQVQRSGGRTTGVTFDDTTNNQESYRKLTKDLHRTRQSFQINSDRDQDFRTMYQWQNRLEEKVHNGTASQEDRDDLVRTYEIFDSVSQRMMDRGVNAEGEPVGGRVSAAGATPASQQVIEQAVRKRTFGLGDMRSDGARAITSAQKDASGRTIATDLHGYGAGADDLDPPNLSRV